MIPDCLAHLPVDDKRKVPIPFVHQHDDGTHDFTALIYPRVHECITEWRCALCGNRLKWWTAFLSGPVSAVTRVYTDPPAHEECMRAALELCPHIMRANMRRAKTHADGEERATPDPETTIMARPSIWVMCITRGYDVIPDNGGLLFQTHKIKRMQAFRNKQNEPGLDVVPADELHAALAAIEAQGFHYQSALR